MSAPSEPRALALSPALQVLDGLVTRLVENQRAVAALEAERLKLFAAASDVIPVRAEEVQERRRRLGSDLPAREVVAEVATALRIGERAVQARLSDAEFLIGAFPDTLEALREGRIDGGHVSAILDAGALLDDPAHRATYEQAVLAIAELETAARLRRHARELVALIDPEAVDRRAEDAEARRAVRMYDLDDDLSRLVLDQPATLIHAIYDRLTQQAKAVRDGGEESGAPEGGADPTADPIAESEPDDPRTMDQLRADIAADLLLTGGPSAHGEGLDAIRAVVQVTVPLAALVPEAGAPAHPGAAVLSTLGPIPIDTARRLAGHTPGWERVCLDPTSGLPVAVDRYKPTARQRAFLTARDEGCRFPGCRRPAHRCDVDHTHDAALGGATCICNLAHFCRRHHTMKHHTAWTVRQVGRGILEWTSPTGRRHEDRPPGMVRFVPTGVSPPDESPPDGSPPGESPPF